MPAHADKSERRQPLISLWALLYLIVPFVSLCTLLVARWGKENLVFYIALPPLVIVCRMFASSTRHLSASKSKNGELAKAHWWAYHLEVAAWVVLLILSVAIAIAAEVRAAPAVIAFLFVGLFGLYWALLFASREQLRDAYRSQEFGSPMRGKGD
jgi:hypothetical protein